MNPTTAFIRGNSIPLPLPMGIVKEFLRHGRSIERIMNIDDEDSPGYLYHSSKGYIFLWGHIREELSVGTEELEGGSMAEWHFCLDSMLATYQDAGSNLSELSDVAESYLKKIGRQFPEFVEIGEGDNSSTFSLYVFNEDIPKARKWIAKKFISRILPTVFKTMRRHLDSPNPNIPLREAPCRNYK